jgi:hypothetical protein
MRRSKDRTRWRVNKRPDRVGAAVDHVDLISCRVRQWDQIRRELAIVGKNGSFGVLCQIDFFFLKKKNNNNNVVRLIG